MSASHESFAVEGVDAVQERLRDQYGKVSFTGDSIALAEAVVSTPTFFLDRLNFTGAYTATAECSLLTAMISSVPHWWRVGDEEGDAHPAPFLMRPETVQQVDCGPDATLVTFAFEPAALERCAQSLYADDGLRVRFDSGKPVNAAYGRYYRGLLSYAATCLPILADSDLLQANVHRLMATGLLECFALRGEPAARRDSVLAQQDGYRRAQTFIDDHAALPITVEDIAHAASLSARQLDDSFHSFSPTATTAAGALRAARLAGAHDDLVAGDPTRGDTVREITLRWGFAPASFARTYRKVYAVTPLHTLNQ